MKKNRGIFLTIILILPLLELLIGIPSFFDPNRMQQNAGLGNWYPPFIYLNAFLKLFLIWGMWMWKKWAVYLSFISFIPGLWISFIVLQNISPSSALISTILGFILSAGLLFWAIYRKWKYFE